MKNLKLIIGLILIIASSAFVISNVVRTDGTMKGNGLSGNPLRVDTTDGKIVTVFKDKHWWNANLTATGNRTHNADFRTSTVNNLSSWSLNFGSAGQAFFAMDSAGLQLQDSGVVLRGGDHVILRGQTGLNPNIKVWDNSDKIEIMESGGDINILGLNEDMTPDSCISINSGLLSTTAIKAGTYVPEGDDLLNIDVLTEHDAQYMRIGNVVTVSGVFELDATAASSVTFTLSIPIESNFDDFKFAGGTASNETNKVGHIVSGSGSYVAVTIGDPGGTNSQLWSYQYTYTIR